MHKRQIERIERNAQIHLEQSVFNDLLPQLNTFIVNWIHSFERISGMAPNLKERLAALDEAIPDKIPHFWFVRDTGIELEDSFKLSVKMDDDGIEPDTFKQQLNQKQTDVNTLRADFVLTTLSKVTEDRLLGFDLYPILELMFNLVHRVGGSIHDVYPVYNDGPLDGFALRTKHHVVYLTGVYPTDKEFKLKGIVS
jgi:hypothetical protein